MGQALNEQGEVLGKAFGDTKTEVFDKLMAAHGEQAHEFRIRKLRDSVDEIEAKADEDAKDIVRRIDAKLGSGWAKELADALDA